MRCSKLCIILLLVGIGGVIILAANGNAKAASLLYLLPFLACPLMCIIPHMFGKSCHDDKCQKKPPKSPPPSPNSL